MSDIQAIILDLDGTLLDSDKSISPRNYSAVKGVLIQEFILLLPRHGRIERLSNL